MSVISIPLTDIITAHIRVVFSHERSKLMSSYIVLSFRIFQQISVIPVASEEHHQ